jgi:hypothetical protein
MKRGEACCRERFYPTDKETLMARAYALPQLVLGLSLALGAVGCDLGPSDAVAAGSKADAKAGGDGAGQADKKDPEPAVKKDAVPTLVERDVSKEAKEHIPGFSGKMTLLAPADATVSQTVGGFNVKSEGYGMTVMVGTVKAKERKTKIESGESPEKKAKIVEEGDGFILYEGESFGQHGFFVMHDLPPIDGITAGCSTPIAQPYPRPIAEAVLKACKSVKVE